MFALWTEITLTLGLVLYVLRATATKPVAHSPMVGAPTSGIWPVLIATTAVIAPFPLPDSKFEWLVRVAVLFVSQGVLTKALCSEQRVVQAWRSVSPRDVSVDHDRAILRTTIFSLVLFSLGWRHGVAGTFLLVTFCLGAALVVDVRREMRFRRRYGFLAEVISTDNVPAVEAIAEFLSRAGVPVMVRGLSVGRLLRLPRRTMDVLVPGDDLVRVEEVLANTEVSPSWADDAKPNEVEQHYTK